MQILKVNKLRGPNIWANSPVLEAWGDLDAAWARPGKARHSPKLQRALLMPLGSIGVGVL